jgi:hypothetical protein
MGRTWEKPAFQIVHVNGECTAYSGTNGDNELTVREAHSDERRCVGGSVLPADHTGASVGAGGK